MAISDPKLYTTFKVFYLQTYSFLGDGTTFGGRFKTMAKLENKKT
ncbi:MAG: hypothetical protein M0Z77_11200 [Thermoplasmatales archaeon]|nr:hypothetical protein [Thermoplasmatales archaeon]